MKVVQKRDWFRTFSPAVLGVVFSIIAIIGSYIELETSKGWSYFRCNSVCTSFCNITDFGLYYKTNTQRQDFNNLVGRIIRIGINLFHLDFKICRIKTNAQH